MSGANNVTVKVNSAAYTYDFQTSGLLRLPVQTPVNALDAASKGYVDAKVLAAAPTGIATQTIIVSEPPVPMAWWTCCCGA